MILFRQRKLFLWLFYLEEKFTMQSKWSFLL